MVILILLFLFMVVVVVVVMNDGDLGAVKMVVDVVVVTTEE